MSDGEEHRYYEDLAVSHVLGGLAASDGQIFRAHLLECELCRARVWELRALAHDLADVERDERRLRAAKAVETKEREEPPAEPEVEEGGGRGARVAVGLLLVAVLALAGWNFMLRTTTERQGELIERLDIATMVLEHGEAGRVIVSEPGIDGWVRVRGGYGVTAVHGLADGETYGIYLLDGAGRAVDSMVLRPNEGRLWEVLTLPALAERLVLTHLVSGPSAEPTGARLLEVELSGTARTAPTSTVAPAG